MKPHSIADRRRRERNSEAFRAALAPLLAKHNLARTIYRHGRGLEFTLRQEGPASWAATFTKAEKLRVGLLANHLGGVALADRHEIEIDGVEIRLRLVTGIVEPPEPGWLHSE